MQPRLLMLSLVAATCFVPRPGFGQEDRTALRLAHLARDLHRSAEVLYGKEATAAGLEADREVLWGEAQKQYTDVFGTAQTRKVFEAPDRSIKALEKRTYDVLEALWGPDWVKASRSPS